MSTRTPAATAATPVAQTAAAPAPAAATAPVASTAATPLPVASTAASSTPAGAAPSPASTPSAAPAAAGSSSATEAGATSTTTTTTASGTTAPAPSTTTTTLTALSFAPITSDEIAAFADKLAQSGVALSPAEQVLLQVIVEQAQAITPADVRALELRQGFAAALASVVSAQAQAWGGGPQQDGWVKIDPIWVKAGSGETGDAIQVTASIVVGVVGSGPAT